MHKKLSALTVFAGIMPSVALADAGAETAANPMGSWLFLGLMMAFFYFMLIRPQAKRAKAHENLIANLEVGDEVATTGGVIGLIRSLGDSMISLEISKGIEISVQRSAIVKSLPKGTLKALA